MRILFVTGLYSLYSYVPKETKAALQENFKTFPRIHKLDKVLIFSYTYPII